MQKPARGDQALDKWILNHLLHRDLSRRYSLPAFTRYTNKALLLLADIELLFELRRREDLKYELSIHGITNIADSWEDLAMVTCRTIFEAVDGRKWPMHSE
jgi:hypothetical protein